MARIEEMERSTGTTLVEIQDILDEHRYVSCRGSVQGACGHKHRSARAVLRCLYDDMQGCKSQGGYSDRGPVGGT